MRDLKSHQLGSIQWYSGLLSPTKNDSANGSPPLPQAIVITGMGGRRASKALATWLDEGNTAQLLVSFGFAGGLSPRVKAGSLWTASEISAKDLSKTPLVTPEFVQKVFDRYGVQTGQLYGVGLPILKAADKASTGDEQSATHCDMESHRIIGLANERGIPSISLRAISDTVHESMPTWILELGRKSTAIANAKQAISSCFKHPHQAIWLPKLTLRARNGSKRLAKVITDLANHR